MTHFRNNSARFPGTFQIAIFLSAVVFLSVWIVSPSTSEEGFQSALRVLSYWRKGFWELLEFTMQMMLILVLGYALANSRPAQTLLGKLVKIADTNSKAVIVTGTTSILAGYLNWGFGLIAGAILARQIGLASIGSSAKVNYPLIGASGYLGMLVWHGGLSASSSLKAAENGHFLAETIGVIPISETIFSITNLSINLMLFGALIVAMYFLSKRNFDSFRFAEGQLDEIPSSIPKGRGMLGKLVGTMILGLSISDFLDGSQIGLAFIDLNYVNMVLLGLGFILFGNVEAYFRAVARGLAASTDILIQFPFYAGILGMMKYSGFLSLVGDWFFQNVSAPFFPAMAFASAAVVNLFIPSGGGQWAVQGPILMDAGIKLGLKPSHLVLAFSYGDQLTNMLQPFWALPLLSITGIPAGSLLKYTVYYFAVALLVFSVGVLLLM